MIYRWEKRKFYAQYQVAGPHTQGGKNRHIGVYENEEDAAYAYNDKMRTLGLDSVRKLNAVDGQGRLVAKPRKSSEFYGVSPHNDKWKAQSYGLRGTRKYLGLFDNETAAAHAVDDWLYENTPDVAANKANFPRLA